MKRLTLFALLALTVPTILTAQGAGPAPSAKPQSAKDRQEATKYMRNFAQCVVRGDGDTARRLLAMSPKSDEEQMILRKVATGRNGCLAKGKLRMSAILMRGAVAEQLYLRTYSAPLMGPAKADAPLPSTSATASEPVYAYADCIVARNAPAADAVIRAEPGSPAEAAALQKTMPTLSSCLAGGEQTQFKVDRTTLRGLLAEALYAMRMSQPQG